VSGPNEILFVQINCDLMRPKRGTRATQIAVASKAAEIQISNGNVAEAAKELKALLTDYSKLESCRKNFEPVSHSPRRN
jgi:hypothetical protein